MYIVQTPTETVKAPYFTSWKHTGLCLTLARDASPYPYRHMPGDKSCPGQENNF